MDKIRKSIIGEIKKNSGSYIILALLSIVAVVIAVVGHQQNRAQEERNTIQAHQIFQLNLSNYISIC